MISWSRDIEKERIDKRREITSKAIENIGFILMLKFLLLLLIGVYGGIFYISTSGPLCRFLSDQ